MELQLSGLQKQALKSVKWKRKKREKENALGFSKSLWPAGMVVNAVISFLSAFLTVAFQVGKTKPKPPSVSDLLGHPSPAADQHITSSLEAACWLGFSVGAFLSPVLIVLATGSW